MLLPLTSLKNKKILRNFIFDCLEGLLSWQLLVMHQFLCWMEHFRIFQFRLVQRPLKNYTNLTHPKNGGRVKLNCLRCREMIFPTYIRFLLTHGLGAFFIYLIG